MPPFHEDQNLYRHVLTNRESSSRTKHKLQLQRLSFLTNDKNYLDHPQNMRRLTRELDRVEREYRNVRRYQDPVKESFKRLLLQQSTTPAMSINHSSENDSTASSSLSDEYSSSADKVSFLSKWFNPEEVLSKEIVSNTSFKDDTLSVVYSFHPTIANHMKHRRAAK